MVKDGLLEKIASYEQRQNRMGGNHVWCNCYRYRLAERCNVVSDTGVKREAIEGATA